MRSLSLILGTLGILGIPVCIGLLIYAAIKKKPKKNFAIGIAASVIVAVVGISIMPPSGSSGVSVAPTSGADVSVSASTSEVEQLEESEKNYH